MRRQSHLLLLAPRSSTFVRSSLGFVLALLSTLPESARAQSTERISVSSAGAQGTGDSLHESSITADSRYVAFQSEADNLVVGDTNGWRDIFVRDLVAGTTTRVSISSSGGQSDGASFRPSISADGRWVAFESDASNLVVGDTNGVSDVFLHDRSSGETTRRSVSTGGAQGNGISYSPCLSADGQWLAFGSQATTLIALANNFGGHVFLHERATGITLLVSTSITGGLEDSTSGEPTLSANGRVIAFVSGSGNLVAGPPAASPSVYVRDFAAGTTVRASVSSTGVPGNSLSQFASLSADGRFVAFQSSSSNLVAGDTNFLTDVFIRDLTLGLTERVSVSSTGEQATGGSDATGQPPGISSDGRYVAFTSWATNLVPGTVGWQAIYLRDRALGETSFVSVSTAGVQANGSSFSPAMSSDGRSVVFQSRADNLAPGDTNGLYDMFVRAQLPTAWTNLGSGLAGVSGVPNLMGSGTLTTGSSGSLVLNSARSSSPAILAISTSSTPVPIRCGTLVPFPIIAVLPLTTDAGGGVALPWITWPAGLAGQSLYFQYAVPDPSAICGMAFSNALRADAP